MRQEYKWRGSLRIGREPSLDIINQGLKEFILHHNNLGRSFVESLANRIKDDEYLRCIDLRYNKLNSDLIMKMLKTLNNNESLACIDLRGNKGYSDNPGVQQTLAQFLQRNLTIGL